MDALAMTHVDEGRLLVLAGDEDDKSVSVFRDSMHAQEELRFEVPRFATDIRGGQGGRFYLSLAIPVDPDLGNRRSSGALEEWNLRGQMLNLIRFPAPITAITQPVAGVIYALTLANKHPIAVGVRLADAKIVAAVPLTEAVTSLDRCTLAGQAYLVSSSPRTHHVFLVNVRSGFTVETAMIADRPRCVAGSSAIAGIAAHPFGTEVSLLRLSLTHERTARIVAPADSVEVEAANDGRLFLLRRFGSSSNIQIWTRAEIAGAGG